MKAETKSLWSALVTASASFMVAKTGMDTAAKSFAQAIVVEVGQKPKAADLDSLFAQLIAGKANQAERKAKSRALALAKSQFDLVLPPEYVKASQKGKAAADKKAEGAKDAKLASKEASAGVVIASMEKDTNGELTAFLVRAIAAWEKGVASLTVHSKAKGQKQNAA